MKAKMNLTVDIRKPIAQEAMKTRVKNFLELAKDVQSVCAEGIEINLDFVESYFPDSGQGCWKCGNAEERGNVLYTDSERDLRTAARPLIEYVRKNYTPMTTVIVTGAGVELLSTEKHVPFEEDWD
ncbi:MAG: hypothetical protein IKZ43_07460 [Acidaminococcaceae bacterium]|nr:hypothetical protein [Acidaminococcaceae bacterium]